MTKLIVTFLLAAVCATLLVSYASADHQKVDEKLAPVDNVPQEMSLDGILDGLRVRRSSGQGQGGQGQGQGQGQGGRRGPQKDGQNGQQGGMSNGAN